jgi:hypothetical protein
MAKKRAKKYLPAKVKKTKGRIKRRRKTNPPTGAVLKLGMLIGVLYAIKKFLGK